MQQQGKEKSQDRHPRCCRVQLLPRADPASARGTGWLRGWEGDKQRWNRKSFPESSEVDPDSDPRASGTTQTAKAAPRHLATLKA